MDHTIAPKEEVVSTNLSKGQSIRKGFDPFDDMFDGEDSEEMDLLDFDSPPKRPTN